ncbi:MAG: putative Zn-dependent oxidoreductase [Microbacterium sp.]|jgi:NADPH:quinone reductase-like Zn-dependent oxidoreductase|nr:putative Zn-dependent oxidoreductase [Microbacterium sp.]
MPRLVRPTAFGGPEVLAVVDMPTPHPQDGEVVVRVYAAGVNPIDSKMYSGSFHGVARALPSIGMECAGVVEAIGADVTTTAIGDEVIVYPVTAAHADIVCVPATSLIPKPPALGWAEAGGLLLAGTTAAHALNAAAVTHDDTVLIHGGAGAVGLMAVQLARAAGANVIATASPPNHALLRELDATPVAFGPGLLDRVRQAAPAGVDAAIDTVGTDEALDVSLAVVGDPGRVASIAGSDRRIGTGIAQLGYGPGQDPGFAVRNAARGRLVEMAGEGSLRVVVAATLPLTEAARAHEMVRSGHAPGKIVLIP